jgi:hypothetical protein
MVTRRKFLGILAGATAAIAVPELLIPKRTFFLPPLGGWRPTDLTYLEQGRRYAEAMARSLMHTKLIARAHVLETLPFQEPSPVLFQLLREIERQSLHIADVPWL